MNLQIERPYVEAMVRAFPDLSPLAEQLRFGNRAEVGIQQLSATALDYLHDLYQQAGPGERGRAAQIATLRKALNAEEAERFAADDLERVLPALAHYLVAGCERGWLFRATSSAKPLAYVITRLDYTPPGDEEAGRIVLELKANARGKIATETVIIRSRDITERTVGEVLACRGFLKETPELLRSYDESTERYFAWRCEYGKQFSAMGTGYYAEDPSASHRSTDWSRKETVVLSTTGKPARLVNDENILGQRITGFEGSGEILSAYLRKASRSMRYDDEIESRMEVSKDAIPKGMFTELPVHGYVLMFHLDLHHHLWVHVDDMQPYCYRPELKDKLVLPREQTDLIDILTAEMDVLMDVSSRVNRAALRCCAPVRPGWARP